MRLLPIATSVLHFGDDLSDALSQGGIRGGDIVVVSSKAIATVEGAMIDLREQEVSTEARALSAKIRRSPEFCAAMLGELKRLCGTIIGTVPGAALTEVRPEGLNSLAGSGHSAREHSASILVANAGLDESNAGTGFAIGWPRDSVMSARKLREELEERIQNRGLRIANFEIRNSKSSIAVIISDSTCMPRRHGVTAIALAVSGMNPLLPQQGRADLFGKPLQITTEAIADQLATAANFLMGNAAQSTPAVIIRDHGLTLSDWEGWVPGIERVQDLFHTII